MQIHTDYVKLDTTGGAMDGNIASNALIAGGVLLGSAWSVGSTVHTLVAAPIASLGTLGLGGLAVAGGAAIKLRGDETFSSDPVTVESQPA